MRYYDAMHKRLVYFERAPSPGFWDEHWTSGDFPRAIRTRNNFVVRWTLRYMPVGARILEGGCGRAQNVYSLHESGYDTYGIDSAEQTVALVNKYAPELKVIRGDVRNLPFDDGFFDGYWSLGVIEHFYRGYNQVASEIARVLKPGGYLFLTFPHMSLLRTVKARLGCYPALPPESRLNTAAFYQFALSAERITREFGLAGFRLVRKAGWDGIKGLKDEMPLLRTPLHSLYNGAGFAARVLKLVLDPTLATWCAHSAMLVLRKNP